MRRSTLTGTRHTATGPARAITALSWAPRLLVAGILFQTLFFKFTAAKESVFIFQTLGMEPWGRIGSGVVELVAGILILSPRGVALGAMLATATMTGALGAHLTKLGLIVEGDGGLLFGLALTVMAGSIALLFIHRRRIPWFVKSPVPATSESGRIA